MKQIILSFILIIYSINIFPQYINYNPTNKYETLLSSNNELNLSKMNDTSAFYKSEIGFTTGFNWFSLFTYIVDPDHEYLYYYDNYIVSLFYVRNLGKIFSLGFELSNTTTKLNTKSTSRFIYYKLNYYINYLNFLPLFRFNILTIGKFNINLKINPYFSYIIYSKEIGEIQKYPIMNIKNNSNNYIMNSKLYPINQSPAKDLNKFFHGFRLGYNIEYAYRPNVSFLFANDFYYNNISNLNITCNCEGKWRSIAFSLGVIYKFNKTYEL
jgi:hypothetical protein